MIDIIKDNYNDNLEEERKEKPIDIITCEYCDSVLGISDDDIIYRDFGCGTILCPCCKKINYLDDHEIYLTASNIEFPIHFCHEGQDISDKEIVSYIKEGFDYFRNNQNNTSWSLSSRDVYIDITKIENEDEDNLYNVVVSKDYYETNMYL